MNMFYCDICDKRIINKCKNKHDKTESHYFLKNFVTNIYNYKNIVWDDVENVIHDNIITHEKKFNEIVIYVLCKVWMITMKNSIQ